MVNARPWILPSCIALIVTVFLGGVGLAFFVVAHWFRAIDPDRSWPAMEVPAIEKWAEVPISIDPTLHCPTPVICRGSSHFGEHYIAPYEPCCDWQFDVTLKQNGERWIRMSSGDDGFGEGFDLVVDASAVTPRMHVFGRAFAQYMGEKPLQGLTGAVTLSTLEWREREPVHVHFQFDYFYDSDVDKWSRIEVCADAPVTLEK